MSLSTIVQESNEFSVQLNELIALPLFSDSEKLRLSDIACSMSMEHWASARLLFGQGLLPSGLVVHRAQFEALVRSIWILYAASNENVSKLSLKLDLESEQLAKNLPQVAEMMKSLSTATPPQAYDVLSRIKDNSWKALNSYVHAGIHPLRRHEEGYPIELIVNVFKNANGVGVVSAMQAAVLSGHQSLQRRILDLAAQYPNCMPPPL